MKTLLIRGADQPPPDLRRIVAAGSTEVAEVVRGQAVRGEAADQVVEWTGREVVVDGRRLCWPEDEDELRMLLQTGG